jgi:hypothetical protein
VVLVAQDAVFLGLLLGLSWPVCGLWTIYVPQVLLTFYLVALGGALFLTGERLYGYAMVFCLGLMFRLWQTVPLCLAAGLLSYSVAYLGTRRCLARFPWQEFGLRPVLEFFAQAKDPSKTKALGWPFGKLAPPFPSGDAQVSGSDALAIGMLTGWWVYAFLSLSPHTEGFLAFLQSAGIFLPLQFVVVLLLGTSAVRYLVYKVGYHSPISLAGRLATGRWIIPGHDQVWVAPLLAPFAAGALLTVCQMLGMRIVYYVPLVVAVDLVLILGLGPSLKAWRLTGNHRIVEGSQRVGAVKVG